MRFLVAWAALYFTVTVLSAFLHQCGHGMGALVDGVHISTGVSSAGDPGKKPSDPDYRAHLPMTGHLSSAALLGPFTNWMLAILCALLLATWRKPNFPGMLLAAGAISNAGVRIFPISRFLVTMLYGAPFIDDETTWGLAANPALHFPMTYGKLDELVLAQPGLVTHNLAAYFWPAVSFLICLTVLWQSYPRAIALFRRRLKSQTEVVVFALIPVVMTPFIYMTVVCLDERIRLNW